MLKVCAFCAGLFLFASQKGKLLMCGDGTFVLEQWQVVLINQACAIERSDFFDYIKTWFEAVDEHVLDGGEPFDMQETMDGLVGYCETVINGQVN